MSLKTLSLFLFTVVYFGYHKNNLNPSSQESFSPQTIAEKITDTVKFNQLTSRGFIKEGSNQLTLDKTMNLQVGNNIIIEIGGEKGKGARGSVGVGGQWPYWKPYNTLKEMHADTINAAKHENRYIGNLEDGRVYRYLKSNGWQVYWKWDAHLIYPMALQATVTSISADGKTIQLNKKAKATTINVNVYYNNDAAMYEQLKLNAVNLPKNAKLAATGLYLVNQKNIRINGNGATLFSPKGVPSLSIQLHTCHNAVIKNINITGNGKFNGIGFNWWAPEDVNPEVNRDDYPPVDAHPWSNPYIRRPGILVAGNDVKVENCYVKNPVGYGIQLWGARDSVKNCTIELEGYDMFNYTGWYFHIAAGEKNNFDHCTFKSDVLVRGMEISQSAHSSFTNHTSINGVWAQNQGIDGRFENCTTILTKNCAAKDKKMLGNPIVSVNQLLRGGNESGVTFKNFTMVQQDSIAPGGNWLRGIICDAGVKNVTIKGGSYIRPDYKEGLGIAQALLVPSDGLLIDGFTVKGRHATVYGKGNDNYEWTYIGVWGNGKGVIKNAVAPCIVAPSGIEQVNNKLDCK